jgi:hypothetical protein
MFFHKHLENLSATVTAELALVFGRGEREDLLAKGKTAEVTELWGGVHLLSRAEGFDIGEDAPAVQGIDGGRKGRLPAVRNAVADLFEKGPF